jgi:cell division protein ZapE
MRDSAYESDEHLPPLGGSVFDAAEYTEPAKRLPLTVIEYYQEALARRGFSADDAQYAAVQRLQRTYEQWVDYKSRRSTALRRMVVRPPLPRGAYLWGPVGRGKSFLMDSFYLTVPLVRKRRVHFHHFMRDIHREMALLKGREDPLDAVAWRVAKRYRLICFDEFHVNDIADAMILGRLLQRTMDRGVVYCMTSNYHPDDLYPNGLQRERFLPTIALIEERLDVVPLDGPVDYRRRTMEQVRVYHAPLGPAAEAALETTFRQVADVEEEFHELDVEGRVIPYRRRAGGVVWFDFDVLCGGPRSQLDYLDLAKRFHTVIVSGVPRMTARQANEARRFTLLVDVFYDAKVKLILSAAASPEELYVEGVLANEFQRCVSRLTEMQTRDYLAQARRRPGTGPVALVGDEEGGEALPAAAPQ